MKQLECLENGCKSDKIKFTDKAVSFTRKKDTKIKYKEKCFISTHIPWTRNIYNVTYQRRGSRRIWMLVSSQSTLAENASYRYSIRNSRRQDRSSDFDMLVPRCKTWNKTPSDQREMTYKRGLEERNHFLGILHLCMVDQPKWEHETTSKRE